MSENQPIILSESGTPFASEQAAREHIKAKELKPDKFRVQKYQGGWAVIDLDAAVRFAAGEMSGGQASDAAAVNEKYFEVEFNQAQGPNDLPHVPLVCNGWDLRAQRGKVIVLPQRFIDIAKNAVQTKFTVDSADKMNPVKPDGQFTRFPFRIIREVTRADFEKCLQAGNAIQNTWIQKLRQASP